MEVEVVVVLGPVDSLEVAEDVLMDVGGERLGGLDLVIDGGVEGEDSCGSGKDLAIETEVKMGRWNGP